MHQLHDRSKAGKSKAAAAQLAVGGRRGGGREREGAWLSVGSINNLCAHIFNRRAEKCIS